MSFDVSWFLKHFDGKANEKMSNRTPKQNFRLQLEKKIYNLRKFRNTACIKKVLINTLPCTIAIMQILKKSINGLFSVRIALGFQTSSFICAECIKYNTLECPNIHQLPCAILFLLDIL